jgi:hypothetical protein
LVVELKTLAKSQSHALEKLQFSINEIEIYKIVVAKAFPFLCMQLTFKEIEVPLIRFLPLYAIVKVKVWGINYKPNMATSEQLN